MVQLVQQVHIHRCLIVHNAITIINSAKVCVLVVFFSYQLSESHIISCNNSAPGMCSIEL